MKKSTFVSLLLALFFASEIAQAQPFTLSQYRAMPYLVNPATTGHLQSDKTQRLALIFRNHWNLPSPEYGGLHGLAAGWDRRFCNTSSDNAVLSMGAFVQSDGTRDGGIHNNQVRVLGAVTHRFFDNIWLAEGFSVGGMEYGFRSDKLTFDRQYNPGTGDFDPDADSGESFFRERGYGWNADAGIRIFREITRAPKQKDWRQDFVWAVGFSLHDFVHPRYDFLPHGKDRTPNRLDPGFSLQAEALILDQRLSINAFFRKQSFSVSRQGQAMLGAAWAFELERKNFFVLGVQARIAAREKGLGGFATWNALTFFGEWKLERGGIRASWDCGLSRIRNRPPNGFELSFVRFLGDGGCPLNCP